MKYEFPWFVENAEVKCQILSLCNVYEIAVLYLLLLLLVLGKTF